jgi:predicted ATPase
MNNKMFRKSIQTYVRASGHFQKDLADRLGLHPKVLSRKLSGKTAHLNQDEIRKIIIVLADWRAIHTQNEAHQLLKAAEMTPNLFSNDEWSTLPLSTLIPSNTPSTLSSASGSSSTRKHNIPSPTTPLIGREWAVKLLQQLLARDDVRLLTLIGAGGSGKTRLALYMAQEVMNTFTEGVWYVDLSGVNDPDMVPLSIAQTLQIQSSPNSSPLQSVISYLRKKHLLLVLDNFEQVGEAARIVASILTEAPRLKILVTSRAVLRVYGEHEFSVPPLDIPDFRATAAREAFQRYASVQLFVERAQAVQPNFTLTSENTVLIARICSIVDGLPLALELAAARVKVLPLASLVERLSQAPLPTLIGGARSLPDRHQTLRKTITWSYNLLQPAEQVQFRRLGIFIGGWSLEAAEAMMQEYPVNENNSSIPSSPLDFLEWLINQSLLTQQPTAGSQARYTMLTTLREYAIEQLTEHGELKQLRDWHACYYLRKVEAAELGLRGPDQLIWLAKLAENYENIRTALEWSLEKARKGLRIDTFSKQATTVASGKTAKNSHLPAQNTPDLLALEVCLRMVSALRPYWEWQGNLIDGRYWLQAVLDVPVNDTEKKTLLIARAKALSQASRLAFLQDKKDQAVELAETSIALWRRLQDPHGLAAALLFRGWVARRIGEYTAAKRLYQEGLNHISVEADPWLYAQLLFHLAATAGFLREYEQMHAYFAQSHEIFERLGDKCACADLLKDQGSLLTLQGCYTQAIDHLSQSIKLCHELNHRQFIAISLGWLSFAIGLQQLPDTTTASIYSAQLRGASDSLTEEISMNPWSHAPGFIQIIQQHIRSSIDEQTWKDALAQGRALSLEEVVDLVLQLRRKTG